MNADLSSGIPSDLIELIRLWGVLGDRTANIGDNGQKEEGTMKDGGREFGFEKKRWRRRFR
jgi:hypothetical protein